MHLRSQRWFLLGLLALILSGSVFLPAGSPLPPRAQTEHRNETAGQHVPATAAAPSAAAPNAAPGHRQPEAPTTLVYTVQKRESLSTIARRFLDQTVYLTREDLEAAIRQANNEKLAKALKPGEQLIIPGIESTPVVERPILIPKDFEVRGIYLTGLMAGHAHGVALIRRWREAGGNAIVFDVKDSDGSVNVPFVHELAPKPPRPPIRDLPKFTRFLHSLDLHAIARIALFRDALLVEKHPELAVRSRRTGEAWGENGKLVWADPSRPQVQDYNLALAKAAAQAGVDEIQFDYVRFPAEGEQADTRFFFQSEHPEWTRAKVISDFLARAYAELHPLGVLFSLDVFGVMAWQRPVDLEHTGQDVVEMARHCDVLSPMVYPSHFFGMDGYARPGDAPEHFISASMKRFEEITEGSPVVLRPWLQAFGWRTKSYSPHYILTQVIEAKENDGVGFLFWNARNDYSKPFVAMPEMRSAPGKYFRGDEIRALSAGGLPASPSPPPPAEPSLASPATPVPAPPDAGH